MCRLLLQTQQTTIGGHITLSRSITMSCGTDNQYSTNYSWILPIFTLDVGNIPEYSIEYRPSHTNNNIVMDLNNVIHLYPPRHSLSLPFVNHTRLRKNQPKEKQHDFFLSSLRVWGRARGRNEALLAIGVASSHSCCHPLRPQLSQVSGRKDNLCPTTTNGPGWIKLKAHWVSQRLKWRIVDAHIPNRDPISSGAVRVPEFWPRWTQ